MMNKSFINFCSWVFIVLLTWNLAGCTDEDTSFDQGVGTSDYQQDTARVNALNQFFKENKKAELSKAKDSLDCAYKLADEIGYDEGKAMSLRHYGSYYNNRSDYETAIVKLEEGKAIFESVDNELGVISCINGLANVAWNKGDYEGAITGYMETAKRNQALDHSSGVAKAYHNIGNTHFRLGRYEKALEFFEKSLTIKRELADTNGIISSLNAIAVVESNQENREKVFPRYFEALDLAVHTENLVKQANILNNIGAEHFYANQLDSTRFYYLRALKLYKDLERKSDVAVTYTNLGGLEALLKNGEASKLYNDSSLQIAIEIGDPYTISRAYEAMASSHVTLGDFEAAFDWIVKFHALKDSIEGVQVKQNVDALQEQFETDKKDQEIIQLEKDREATGRETTLYYTIFGISILVLAFLLISILLYYRQRKIKEIQVRGELEQKALRSQMNPHFIFNSLNSIQRLYVEGKEDMANDYMADFSRLLRQILENSSMDKISLKEELRSTQLYLELEKMRTNNQFDYNVEIDPEIDPLSCKVPPLILQPYVENSIWHGIIPKNEKGNIQIRIKRLDNGSLEYEIDDDGVGFNAVKTVESSEKKSKAMSITRERLGGDKNVEVLGNEQGGTRIKLRIQPTI